MTKYGVLVVDDSALMRKSISLLIESHPDFYVIGKARNGLDALEKINMLQPALVTIDVEMPKMDGLSTLKQIMVEAPRAVIVITNYPSNKEMAFHNGAVDFMLKKRLFENQVPLDLGQFHHRLEEAMQVEFHQPVLFFEETSPQVQKSPPLISEFELVVIGSSTGGPSALQEVLTNVPSNFPAPILIIQHMPPGFTKPLAQRFNQSCEIEVKEVAHNELLVAGTVYIAPAGIQTSVNRNGLGQLVARHHEQTEIPTLYHPSIDVALLSVAAEVKDKLLSVILTGMGNDGLRGCQEVKQYDGKVIVEAEESCVVYGMPKVVAEAGFADVQVPIKEVYKAISQQFKIEF